MYTLLFPVKTTHNILYGINNYFDTKSELSELNIDGYYTSDNKECGYFSTIYGMVSSYSAGENEYVIANQFGYVTFSKVGNKIDFYSPGGKKYSTIENFGYPYLLENYPYVFILKTNGCGFSQYNITGELIKDNISFNSMITSISSDKESNTLISTVDGKVYYYDIDGALF